MNFIFEKISYIFDPLHNFWEHEKMHRRISVLLVFFFLLSLFAIELGRQDLLPEEIAAFVPQNHFYAVQAAFTVVLLLEVTSLIFILPCSFSYAVGKQFEILALILLRNAFKELTYFPEPISFVGNEMAVLKILSDGFGALLMFGLLAVYYHVQRKYHKNDENDVEIVTFVNAKKGIALILLASFVGMGAWNGCQFFCSAIKPVEFFNTFYTLLILTDILVVLVGQCFQPSFYAMFRNSGFALATLIIRLALAAPAFYDVALGIASISFAIILLMISYKFYSQLPVNIKK